MFRYNDPAEAEKLRKEGSKNHVNLSRLSFMSRSATDLALSDITGWVYCTSLLCCSNFYNR